MSNNNLIVEIDKINLQIVAAKKNKHAKELNEFKRPCKELNFTTEMLKVF